MLWLPGCDIRWVCSFGKGWFGNVGMKKRTLAAAFAFELSAIIQPIERLLGLTAFAAAFPLVAAYLIVSSHAPKET